MNIRKLYSPELINFCFEQNRDYRKPEALAESPDEPCPSID